MPKETNRPIYKSLMLNLSPINLFTAALGIAFRINYRSSNTFKELAERHIPHHHHLAKHA